MKLKIFFILLFIPHLVWAQLGQLTQVKLSNGEDSARLEFFVTQSATYHVFTLENPHRLVVDFKDVRLKTSLQQLSFNNTPIHSARVGYPKPATLRLVFDLNKNIRHKTFTQDNKIILDLYHSEATIPQRTKKPVAVASKNSRPFVVVIDPGHGGKDPGAIGRYGTQEKHVVLAISHRLAKLINQQPNMRAVLTRHDDHFVPLTGRLKLARKGKADLFVAIHADSYFNQHSHGASVYALSRRGASSVAARWLSNRENHSELGGVDLRELDDQSLQLRSVLIDLAQTATTADSVRLGSSMLTALDNVVNLHYSRVETAPFLVLKSPDIPSILVETGFLSNSKEEEKLNDPHYQNKLAQALFEGISRYVKKHSV